VITGERHFDRLAGQRSRFAVEQQLGRPSGPVGGAAPGGPPDCPTCPWGMAVRGLSWLFLLFFCSEISVIASLSLSHCAAIGARLNEMKSEHYGNFIVAYITTRCAGNLRAPDHVIIYDDGMVTDAHGDVLGNIYDANSESTIRTFATLRFAGDALDPEEMSRVLEESPTRAYRKGQSYRPGPRSPEVNGKTGVWFLRTKRRIQSKDVVDHLNALERIIAPFGDQDNRLNEIRDIMQRKNLQAHVTFFWRGRAGAKHPSIPSVATVPLRRLPADIEADIDIEDC